VGYFPRFSGEFLQAVQWKIPRPAEKKATLPIGQFAFLKMIIYSDIFSHDELCSDAYKMEIVDDVIIKFESKLVESGDGKEIKIYDGDAFGGKTEPEEGEETGPVKPVEETNKVNEIIHKFQLQPTGFNSLKDYQASLKGYLKRLTDHMKEKTPDRVAPFQKGIQKFVGEFFKKNKFADVEFYTGSSFDNDSGIVLCAWNEEKTLPYIYLFKDGVKGIKN
jgi:hypothetical protein